MYRRRILCTLQFFLLISNKFCNEGASRAGRLSSFMHLSVARAGRLSSFIHLLPHTNSMGPEIHLAGSCTLNHLEFWAPNGTRLSARCYITGPKKLKISRAKHLPTCPSNGYARIQNIMHGAV